MSYCENTNHCPHGYKYCCMDCPKESCKDICGKFFDEDNEDSGDYCINYTYDIPERKENN